MPSTAHNATSDTDGWTIQRILEWTTGFLKQKGIESPRVEAELLLAHARKCPRIRLYTDFNSILPETERAAMRELVQRRAKREPLAYIIGSREFYGRSFEVGPAVLIPRPETETLVDVCLELLPQSVPVQLIEVGIGSGCVSISLALQRHNASLAASDISDAALEIAGRNAQKHSGGMPLSATRPISAMTKKIHWHPKFATTNRPTHCSPAQTDSPSSDSSSNTPPLC